LSYDTYELLKQRPAAFESLTGIGVSEFDKLYHHLVPMWTDGEHERLNRANRRRAIGGGHPYSLELADQLLMSLLWLHLRLNTIALSFLFGVDKATVSRNTRRMWQILPHLNEPTLAWPKPPKRGHSKNLGQACRDYPDLLAIVQLSEQSDTSASAPNQQPVLTSSKQIDRRLIYGIPGG
jgi:hypothetical protein